MAERARDSFWGTRFVVLASAAIVVLALYFGRELIVPIVVAALVGFVLMPSVLKLERLGLRRSLAVAITSFFAFIVVATVLFVVVVEIRVILTTLPAYEQNIRTKLASLGIERALRIADDFDISSHSQPSGPTPPAASAEVAPTPVRIVEPARAPRWELLLTTASRALGPMAFMGLVTVFAVILLLSWEDVRERIIRLVSRGRLTLTTRAIDEVARTISTVLRAQLVINTGFGLAAGVLLWAIGVPAAPLWGCLVVLLRFIPYVGVAVAAAMPLLLAVAASDGWMLPLMIAGIFLLLELIAGNLVEPAVLGSRAGVSTLALLVSAAFWTWLWGLPGLFLSTPITVGLAVVGRHVPQLSFLDILLGDSPALTPQARFYQRLVASDGEDAAKVAVTFHAEHDLIGLMDDLLMPALRQIERDRHEGLIDDDRVAEVMDLLLELVDDAVARDTALPKPPGPRPVPSPPPGLVLCVPAHDDADAVAAAMLAASAAVAGMPARALSPSELGGDLAAIIRESGARVVCISAVPPFAARSAKLRRRMLQTRVPSIPVLTGLWAGHMPTDATPARPGAQPSSSIPTSTPPSDPVITSLPQMLARLAEPAPSDTPAPTPQSQPPA